MPSAKQANCLWWQRVQSCGTRVRIHKRHHNLSLAWIKRGKEGGVLWQPWSFGTNHTKPKGFTEMLKETTPVQPYAHQKYFVTRIMEKMESERQKSWWKRHTPKFLCATKYFIWPCMADLCIQEAGACVKTSRNFPLLFFAWLSLQKNTCV